MNRLLQWLMALNAALWLGGATFFTFLSGPAFFTPEMIEVLGRPQAGRAAQLMVGRYFWFLLGCGVVSVGLTLLAALQAGLKGRKIMLYLALGACMVAGVGGFWLQPKLQRLHAVMYRGQSTGAEVLEARKSFGLWHGVSQAANLVLWAGLLVHWSLITSGGKPAGRPPLHQNRS